MKNKILTIIALLLISVQSYSFDILIFDENIQTSTEDFTLTTNPNARGWYLRPLEIPLAYSPGFKVQVEFSVPQNSIDGVDVFCLGGMYNQDNNVSNFHKGYALKLKNNTFLTERMVSLEEKPAKTVSYSAWDSNILKKGHNYILIFEIDETRLRITTYEDANMDVPVSEYEFNGLSHSHLKTILSGYDTPGEFYFPAICLDKRLPVRRVSVWKRTTPMVVSNPQTTSPFVVNISNSDLYIRPVEGKPESGTELEINTLVKPLWSMWEVTPLFDKNRTLSNFKVKLRNLQSNKYMVVKDASPQSTTPIIQSTDDFNNNSIWNLEFINSSYFKLKNESTKKYAIVNVVSAPPGAKIVEYETASTRNSIWSLKNAGFDAPIKDGYYKIKNKNSNYYLGLGDDFAYARQCYFSNYGTDNIWYVQKQPGGTYTMTNVLTGKYLYQNFLKVRPYPYPCLESKDPAGIFGTVQWTLVQYDAGIEIYHSHHMESLCIEGASKNYGAYSKLMPRSSEGNPPTYALWDFIPVDYTLDVNLEGFYKMKYAPSNLYLVVKDASLSEGEKLVSSPTADTKNGWWYLKKSELGGYLIYNVKSSMLLTNITDNPTKTGTVYQYYQKNTMLMSKQLWKVQHSDEYNKYIISNFYGLNSLKFNSLSPMSDAITAGQYQTSSKWIFEPINLPATKTRSIQLEPEDGIFEAIPTKNSSRSNSETTGNINNLPMEDGFEAYYVENELLVKCNYIIKSVDIYDINGKLMGNHKVSNSFAAINVSNLPSGVFVARIQIQELGYRSIKFTK